MSLLPLFYFNFKKENKVFLGDAGSLLLGSIISINSFSFLSQENYSFSINPIFIFILILLYPIFDLARVFFIRIYNKKSPFIADKIHIHHILLNKINSQILTTVFLIGLNLIIFTFLILLK